MRVVCANHSALPFPNGTETAARAAAVRAQEEAGLDVVTDGHPGWPDPITPLLAPLDGVRLGGPHLLPCGLTLARRPIVQAKLRRHAPLCVDALRASVAVATVPVKVTLTGPYTLAHAAEIATTAYRSPTALAHELATLLAQEITALAAAGLRVLQIDEPLLLARPQDARLVRAVLEPPVDAAGAAVTVLISTYGADAGEAYAQLNTLPGDLIAVDCAGRPQVAAAIAETGAGKPLALGLVDDRGAPAPLDALRSQLDRLLQRYAHDELWLQPACGLAALDPTHADAALRRLATLTRTLAPAPPPR